MSAKRRLLRYGLLAAYLLATTVAAILRRDALSGAMLMAIWFIPLLLVMPCVDNLLIVYERRKSGYAKGMGWFYLAVIGLFSLWLWYTIWVVSLAARGSAEEEGCRANLRQLTQALQIYAKEHDDALPPADHWADLLLPYVADRKAFVCPAAPKLRSGYAYNRALAGRPLSALADAEYLVALYESDRGWNAAGGPELLTRKPRHGYRDRIRDLYGSASGKMISRVRLSAVSPEERSEYAERFPPAELEWEPKVAGEEEEADRASP